MSNDDHSKAVHPYMMVDENERKQKLHDECLAFFNSLPEAKFDFATFQKHWNAIDRINLLPPDLTMILTNAINALDHLEKSTNDKEKKRELRKNCLSEMMFRFSCWEKPAAKQVDSFRPHDLAICLRNHRILAINPHDKFLRGWYKKANPSSVLKGSDYETRIIRSLTSFAVANLKPTEEYKKEWTPKAIRSAPYFRPGQLAFALWAHAKLAEEPDAEFFKEWKKRYDYLITEYPDHFRQRDLANIIGSSATLHAITGKTIYKEIAEAAKNEVKFDDCDLPQMRQLWFSHLWFDWDYPASPPTLDDRESPTEIQVKNIFAEHAYPTAEDGKTVRKLGHRPDNNHMINGQEVFLEFDGNTHFLFKIGETDGRRRHAGYTGRTLFMSALIKKFEKDAVILRMPAPVGRSLIEMPEDRQGPIITDLMNDAVQMQPGAYHIRKATKAEKEKTDGHHLTIRPLKIADLDSLA